MAQVHHADADQVDAARIVLRREFDAEEINRIVNDPAVFPSITCDGVDKLDLSGIVGNPQNVLLMTEGGGIVFAADEPGIYEVHTSFLPDFRGKHAIDASLQAYRWMFTHTDCMRLQTKIPAFNRPAMFAARKVGFEREFRRVKAWKSRDGDVDLTFYSLPYERWLWSCDDLIESGRKFHDRLDEEYKRHGREPHTHIDERSHDRAVGVAVETLPDQPEKAIILYNRWARFSGYVPAAMISRNPLVVSIQDALLLFSDRSFKVIKCR